MTRRIRTMAVGLFALAALAAGWAFGSSAAVAGGAAGCCWLVCLAAEAAWRRAPGAASPVTADFHRPAPRPPVDPGDSAAMVRRMLDEQRFALLLRPRIAARLTDAQWAEALAMLERHMALVPGGEVVLNPNGSAVEERPAELYPAQRAAGQACAVGLVSSIATR